MIALIFAEGGLPPEYAWPYILATAIGLGGLLMIGVLVMTFALLWKKVFGKQPEPAPATPQPFLVTTPDKFVDVDTMEDFKAEVSDFKTDVHNQLKEMRTYMHEEAHETRGQQQKFILQLNEVKASLQLEGSRRAKNINERVDTLNGTVHRLDERTATTNSTLIEQGRKIDILLSRKP